MMESQRCAMTNKIIFHSAKTYNNKNGENGPVPAANSVPFWWKDADRYIKDPNGEPYINASGVGKVLSYKSCPAMLDTFTSGYMLRTPCDLDFYIKRGRTKVRIPVGFEDIVGEREPMEGFQTPPGFDDRHFHWYLNWAPQVPKGYSTLYVQPLNHFDLPYVTVAGIIDSDKVTNSGLLPFFLKTGFEGVVPAGTPIVQIFPFKREDWEMEYKFYTPEEIFEQTRENSLKFRDPNGGVYKRDYWEKRKYK
jgi:hypothetical protein